MNANEDLHKNSVQALNTGNPALIKNRSLEVAAGLPRNYKE